MTILRYEVCDSLAEWTIDVFFNPSITGGEQEGDGCVNFYNDAYTSGLKVATPDRINIGGFPSGQFVVGFWFKTIDQNSQQFDMAVISPSNQMRVEYDWHPFSSTHRLRYWVNGVYGDIMTISNNTWYWIELVWVNKDLQKFYVNGDLKVTVNGRDVDFNLVDTIFRFDVLDSLHFGHVRLDYILLMDEEEYPPPPLPSPPTPPIIPSEVFVTLWSECCGEVGLERVLNWHEEEEVSIPIKRIVRKESPTVQAEYFARLPRRIELELKSSRSEKVLLEACKHRHGMVDLYDYDETFVDCVWIERLNYGWVGGSDHNYPWRGRLVLLCSST